MINFIKQQLTLLKMLSDRDSELDKIMESRLNTNYYTDIFSSASSGYISVIIDCLSQLFTEPEGVKDWIEYMLYEVNETDRDNITHADKSKHTISSVDTLCDYLGKFYILRK